MPPDYSLRPPTPGARGRRKARPPSRPRAIVTGYQAERHHCCSPTRSRRSAKASRPAPNPPARSAFLQSASLTGIDPNIRKLVDEETSADQDASQSFLDDLIFWRAAGALRHRGRSGRRAEAPAGKPGPRPADRYRRDPDHRAQEKGACLKACSKAQSLTRFRIRPAALVRRPCAFWPPAPFGSAAPRRSLRRRHLHPGERARGRRAAEASGAGGLSRSWSTRPAPPTAPSARTASRISSST